jgi:hypothetical protein
VWDVVKRRSGLSDDRAINSTTNAVDSPEILPEPSDANVLKVCEKIEVYEESSRESTSAVTKETKTVRSDLFETCLKEIHESCLTASQYSTPLAPADCAVLAAVKAAQVHAVQCSEQASSNSKMSRPCTPQDELQSTIATIQKCCNSADVDERVAAFQVFHRAVSRILVKSDSKDGSPEKVLEHLEHKETVLRFLVDVHSNRKFQRKRVASTLNMLLGFDLWLQALLRDKTLCAKLPLDLQEVAKDHMVRKAEENLKRSVADMGKLSFCATPPVPAGDAFDLFKRATRELERSTPEDYARILESLEPKAGILKFVMNLHKLDSQRRRAARSLFRRWLELHAWRLVIEADPGLHEQILCLAQDREPRGHFAAPSVSSRCCCSPGGGQSTPLSGDSTPMSSRSPNVSERSPNEPAQGEVNALCARSGITWFSYVVASLMNMSSHRRGA